MEHLGFVHHVKSKISVTSAVVSKTQTSKTQTSDPKNSDPLGVSKTQTLRVSRKLRPSGRLENSDPKDLSLIHI